MDAGGNRIDGIGVSVGLLACAVGSATLGIRPAFGKSFTMKKYFAALGLLAAITLSSAGGDDLGGTLVKVGDTAPSFTATTTGNEQISPESQKGKVIFINFFATWCGPCMSEMPALEASVWQKFKDRGLVFVAIGREHSAAEMVKFKEDKHLTMPIAPDPKREIYSKFATQYIPRSILIGRDGKILFATVGFAQAEFDQMVALIDTELGKGK